MSPILPMSCSPPPFFLPGFSALIASAANLIAAAVDILLRNAADDRGVVRVDQDPLGVTDVLAALARNAEARNDTPEKPGAC